MMKTIISSIKEARNENYFFDDTIQPYLDAITNAVSPEGYMTVVRGTYNKVIELYKKNTPKRSQTFKNMICMIHAKDYIDWGKNEKTIAPKLEPIILDAIKSVK